MQWFEFGWFNYYILWIWTCIIHNFVSISYLLCGIFRFSFFLTKKKTKQILIIFSIGKSPMLAINKGLQRWILNRLINFSHTHSQTYTQAHSYTDRLTYIDCCSLIFNLKQNNKCLDLMFVCNCNNPSAPI